MPRAWVDAGDLPLLARGIVEGMLSGLHRSPYIGYGREFSSYRPYVQGDSLRHVDWKVWSRTDSWYVKQFEDETNLVGRVFPRRQRLNGHGGEKQVPVRPPARRSAGLPDDRAARRARPRGLEREPSRLSSAPQFQAADGALATLSQANAARERNADRNPAHLLEGVTRRGLAVIISDFLAEDGEAIELCETMTHHRQEVVAFQILSPEECDLSLEGNVILVDSETGEERLVEPETARREYKEQLEAHCAAVQKRCWNAGVDYHRCAADEPVEDALRAYLLKREQLPVA